jgi:hypothetical protein
VDIISDQTTHSKTFNTIYLNSYVYDSIGSAGTDSQILMTTTNGVNCVDISSVNTNYLTITDAASTYLTITDVRSIYHEYYK